MAINDKLKVSSVESTDAEEDEKGVLVLSILGLFAGESFILGDPILNRLSRAAASCDKFGVEVRFFWSAALVDDDTLSNGGRTFSSFALCEKRLEDSTTIAS